MPEDAVPNPVFAIASPNATNASALAFVLGPSISSLENSTNLLIGVLPPKNAVIPSDIFCAILPMPAAAPPTPNTAKPLPKSNIPSPVAESFLPSSFSKL